MPKPHQRDLLYKRALQTFPPLKTMPRTDISDQGTPMEIYMEVKALGMVEARWLHSYLPGTV